MTFLTDFADQAVVLPLVAAVALMLAALGWWRQALAWLGVIGITFATILILKLGFLACQPVFGSWALRSPSGHAAAAASVAGSLAALLTRRHWLVLAVATVAAAAIGVSRVELGLHSVPEILLGGAIGIAGASAFSRLAGPPPARRPVSLLAVVAVVAVLLHGTRLPAEAAIWKLSRGALDFVPACRG
jgi:membrane-associated phospholipid phosphatase